MDNVMFWYCEVITAINLINIPITSHCYLCVCVCGETINTYSVRKFWVYSTWHLIPITSWQIDRETVETVTDCFWGLQNHCKWWLQPWNKKTLAPWKKSYDQPRQHIKKQRHYFASKGPSSQGYGFSSSNVWMWELGYKAEHWRTDAFELWCWRRLLRVPWTARRSNQST